MRSKGVWAICLLALLLCFLGSAGAEGVFQRHCDAAGLESPEVIAWLEIPGASLLQPVMQRPEDDAFYAAHDAYGNEKSGGSLYTQASYNAADFSDPVTLIYGSSADESAPLRNLQELYSGSYEQCRTIYVHLPEGTQEYIVFAAIPFSNIHILHYYDFRVERRFVSFFDDVFATRALAMHLNEEERPEAGADRVLILSTSLRGDKTQRYLVMARLLEKP